MLIDCNDELLYFLPALGVLCLADIGRHVKSMYGCQRHISRSSNHAFFVQGQGERIHGLVADLVSHADWRRSSPPHARDGKLRQKASPTKASNFSIEHESSVFPNLPERYTDITIFWDFPAGIWLPYETFI
jgi:hypothetical protein